MTQPTPRLAVFISGAGRTLVNLAHLAAGGALRAEVALVVASRPCPGLDRARELGIRSLTLPPAATTADVERVLTQHRIDFAALAGFLRLLPVPPAFAGRVLNIHPALLPSFGGPGMHGRRVHEAVLASGMRVSGCTVHVVDERYDAGPIVLQRVCPVLDDDTPDSLAARVFEQECLAYPEALGLLLARRLEIQGRTVRIRRLVPPPTPLTATPDRPRAKNPPA